MTPRTYPFNALACSAIQIYCLQFDRDLPAALRLIICLLFSSLKPLPLESSSMERAIISAVSTLDWAASYGMRTSCLCTYVESSQMYQK
jgi:hypothetical protein